MNLIDEIVEKVKALSEPERIELFHNYFQCKPGGYGYGDEFLAVRVPLLRKVAKAYENIDLDSCKLLLQHRIHEIRLLALFIMVAKYKRKTATDIEKESLVALYLSNTSFINNWDLVDSSAHFIVGAWCFEHKSMDKLFQLADSDLLWDNRIAIISTFYHIRNNHFEATFDIALKLMHHKHDLIHKGVGWMLREVGKKDFKAALKFLALHYKEMPRTMLRYAIEKFDKSLREDILRGSF